MAEELECLRYVSRLCYVWASGYNHGTSETERPVLPSTKTMRMHYFPTFAFFLAVVALLVVVRADDYVLYTSTGGVAHTLTMPLNVIAITVEVVG